MSGLNQAREVDQNYDFFQRNVGAMLAEHRNQFVLLHHRSIVDFFNDVGEAYLAGRTKFPDDVFSIQEVTDEPVDLGIFSHAGY